MRRIKNLSKKLLETVIDKLYLNVVWSHKIHETAADELSKWYNILVIAQIFIGAIISGGIITIIISNFQWVEIGSAGVSFLSVVLAALIKSYDFPKLISNNSSVAKQYLALRDKIVFLIAELKEDMNRPDEDKKFEKKYSEFLETYNAINEVAPRVWQKCIVKKAKVNLFGSSEQRSDAEELKILLPKELLPKENNID